MGHGATFGILGGMAPLPPLNPPMGGDESGGEGMRERNGSPLLGQVYAPGSGGQRSTSHVAKNRFGDLEEAPFSTPLVE